MAIYKTLLFILQLLWDLKTLHNLDADHMMVANLNQLAAGIMERAPKSKLRDQCVETVDACLEDSVKKSEWKLVKLFGRE